MQSFRHFVAVSVGAAIALNYVEPGTLEDVPSLAQSKRDRAENQNTQPGVAPTQGSLTESAQTKQKAVKPAGKGNDSAPGTSVLGIVPSLFSKSLAPQKIFIKTWDLGDSRSPLGIGVNEGWAISTDKSRGLNKDAIAKAPVIDQSVVHSLPEKFFSFSTTKGYSLGKLAELFTDLSPTPNRQPLTSFLVKATAEEVSIPLLTSSLRPVVGLDFTPLSPTPDPQALTSLLVKPPKEEVSIPLLASNNAVISDDHLRLQTQVVSEVLAPLAASDPNRNGVPRLALHSSKGAAALLSGVKRWKLSENPTLETLQKVSELGEAVTDKPISSLGNTSLVQYPAILTAQSSQGNQTTPPPEFLNPSPNPLLFPTQSEEVQIRGTQPITLQQALELAQRNNRDLQAAQLTLERSQAALQEALAAEFPTAGVVADFSRSDSATTELRNEQNPSQQQSTTSSTFNAGVQLSYDLYTAGRRPAQIRAAEEQIRFQELDLERISEQLRLNVSSAYYDLQQADAQVEISQAAVTDAAQSLRDAQLLEQAGLGTRFDVLQAQVQLANANQDLTTALSQQRISRRQMVQLLSLAQPVEVSAADPIAVAGDWNLSLEQSTILAYKNRAELEQQLVQRNISDQRRRVALAAVRPQATLTASYNILGVLNDDLGPADGLTLGAGLRWNFFEGGAARARAQQEQKNIQIAETQFASQRNQVRFDVEQAFFQLNASRQNIQTASFALTQAEESLRLARLRFQAGVGTQTDVINQQTELTRARGNQIRAILDYNRALAQLQRAVSNLPNSNLSDVP
jgi:outer membrane protein TolC